MHYSYIFNSSSQEIIFWYTYLVFPNKIIQWMNYFLNGTSFIFSHILNSHQYLYQAAEYYGYLNKQKLHSIEWWLWYISQFFWRDFSTFIFRWLGMKPICDLLEGSVNMNITSNDQFSRYDSDSFWDCAIRYLTGNENHQAGSCKMGPASDPLAVVDHELQVHGISGLRVMDSSIMPKVTSGNTHAPIVMIAEKGVQHIKDKYLASR